MQKIDESACQKEKNRILHVENRRNYMSNTRKKNSPCRKPKNHGDDSVRLLSHELEELGFRYASVTARSRYESEEAYEFLKGERYLNRTSVNVKT